MLTIAPIVDEFRNGATAEHPASIPPPEAYVASYGSRDGEPGPGCGDSPIDVRKTLWVGEVEVPELAPDEVLVAVMASCVNYNTVWTAKFAPVPTFRFLERLGCKGRWSRHRSEPPAGSIPPALSGRRPERHVAR